MRFSRFLKNTKVHLSESLSDNRAISNINQANGSTQPIELKKAHQPPAAVLQAFAVDVARFERFGDTQVILVSV